LGKACRYDGQSKETDRVQAWVEATIKEGGTLVAVCPEELGGLGTPRPPAQLVGGDGADVLQGAAQVETERDNVTDAFVAGAIRAANQGSGATEAVLKARSPSCGCGEVWKDGALSPGDGVFAALLKSQGVSVRTDEDLP
jgi:uncharacterized protein YbbK (DUF523 family)